MKSDINVVIPVDMTRRDAWFAFDQIADDFIKLATNKKKQKKPLYLTKGQVRAMLIYLVMVDIFSPTKTDAQIERIIQCEVFIADINLYTKPAFDSIQIIYVD